MGRFSLFTLFGKYFTHSRCGIIIDFLSPGNHFTHSPYSIALYFQYPDKVRYSYDVRMIPASAVMSDTRMVIVLHDTQMVIACILFHDDF